MTQSQNSYHSLQESARIVLISTYLHTSLTWNGGLFFRAIGGEVTTDGDFLIFEGNKYDRRGFLYKNFVMSAIVSCLLYMS